MIRAAALTAAAMIAFAANSVLSRMALIEGEAGAGGFALIRLVSGAAAMALIIVLQKKSFAGDWKGGAALFGYAAFFSYAYLALGAGMGALILFACVQITMLGAGLLAGERMTLLQASGAAAAAAGLIWLVSPGLEAPSSIGAAAMAVSGVCWGLYSLIGRGAGDPTAVTAGNFLRAAALALPLIGAALWIAPEPIPSSRGILLAILSGAVTSGLGYVVWYAALKHLTAIRAGLAQLTVPVIAAFGGVIFLAEPLTLRFTLATLAILGGVAVAITPKR